jgi:hypothetical protein
LKFPFSSGLQGITTNKYYVATFLSIQRENLIYQFLLAAAFILKEAFEQQKALYFSYK